MRNYKHIQKTLHRIFKISSSTLLLHLPIYPKKEFQFKKNLRNKKSHILQTFIKAKTKKKKHTEQIKYANIKGKKEVL